MASPTSNMQLHAKFAQKARSTKKKKKAVFKKKKTKAQLRAARAAKKKAKKKAEKASKETDTLAAVIDNYGQMLGPELPKEFIGDFNGYATRTIGSGDAGAVFVYKVEVTKLRAYEFNHDDGLLKGKMKVDAETPIYITNPTDIRVEPVEVELQNPQSLETMSVYIRTLEGVCRARDQETNEMRKEIKALHDRLKNTQNTNWSLT